eukprot:s851_g6.t1
MACGPPRPPSAPRGAARPRPPPPRGLLQSRSPSGSETQTPELETPRARPELQPIKSREPEQTELERPRTHCGALKRASYDEEVDVDASIPDTRRDSSDIALGLGCPSCAKLRLKLEHSERARVKAQEQLCRVQRESIRPDLRFRCRLYEVRV